MPGLRHGQGSAESSDRLLFQMVSFSIDPQWCGLLFSVCCRHEKTDVLGAETFATCSGAPPALAADWIAFAGSVGFEICRLSSSWALVLETVKAGGVILLLGVGSFVCYKLYRCYRPRSGSGLNSPNSSPPHPHPRHPDNVIFYGAANDNQLIEDLDDEDISSIEGRYFGPSPAPSKNNLKHGINVVAYLRKVKFFCNHTTSSSSSQSESGTWNDEGREAETFDKRSSASSASSPCGIAQLCPSSRLMNLNVEPGVHRSSLKEGQSTSWLLKRLRSMLPEPQREEQGLGRDFTSLPVSPGKKNRHKTKQSYASTGRGIKREDRPRNTSSLWNVSHVRMTNGNGESPLLPRDESYDSLGFSTKLRREGSFDSTCSELSFDFSLVQAAQETSTMLCLDNLQNEIDQLKNNCLMMDEEFEIIKCNRNLPGMSSLMTTHVCSSNDPSGNRERCPHDALKENLKQEHARACFAGLYSLTTIKNSTSSDVSDSLNGNGRASVGSAESLAWDSPVSVASPIEVSIDDVAEDNRNISEVLLGASLLDSAFDYTGDVLRPVNVEGHLAAADLEWDEEGYEESAGIAEKPLKLPLSVEDEIAESKSKELNCMVESTMSTTSTISERSSRAESGFESKLTDSSFTDSSYPWCNEYNLSTSIESNASGWSSQHIWNETMVNATNQVQAESNKSSNTNIGVRVDILQYVESEWRGGTSKARTILKAYRAIPSILGTRNMRRIRGDNYCGVRAAIFQILSKGYPIPIISNRLDRLTTAFQDKENKWLQDWNFAGRLQYNGNNVLYGMQTCLNAINHVVSTLAAQPEREDYLADMLNHNPALDVHIMEGVKLMMLLTAMELHEANCQGLDVPLFAILMFTRDTSETPHDFMNNHLKDVGNSGGLEQVEMYLLGYAFHVTLRVVRPAAYGCDDFICCYPDCHIGTWPEVVLIADDDRHYNILVE